MRGTLRSRPRSVIVGALVVIAAAAGVASIRASHAAAPPAVEAPGTDADSSLCPIYSAPQPIGNEQLGAISYVRASYYFDLQSYSVALSTLSSKCVLQSRTGSALALAEEMIACLASRHVAISWDVNASAPDGSVQIQSPDEATITERVKRVVALVDPGTGIASDPQIATVSLTTQLRFVRGRWVVTSVNEGSPSYAGCA